MKQILQTYKQDNLTEIYRQSCKAQIYVFQCFISGASTTGGGGTTQEIKKAEFICKEALAYYVHTNKHTTATIKQFNN